MKSIGFVLLAVSSVCLIAGNSFPPLARAGTGEPKAPGVIVVQLPLDAILLVDDNPTTLTSELRTFRSPPLEPGEDYFYTLTALVSRDGKMLRLQQRVTLRAGQEIHIVMDLAHFVVIGIVPEPSSLGAGSPEDGLVYKVAGNGAFLLPKARKPGMALFRFKGDTKKSLFQLAYLRRGIVKDDETGVKYDVWLYKGTSAGGDNEEVAYFAFSTAPVQGSLVGHLRFNIYYTFEEPTKDLLWGKIEGPVTRD